MREVYSKSRFSQKTANDLHNTKQYKVIQVNAKKSCSARMTKQTRLTEPTNMIHKHTYVHMYILTKKKEKSKSKTNNGDSGDYCS